MLRNVLKLLFFSLSAILIIFVLAAPTPFKVGVPSAGLELISVDATNTYSGVISEWTVGSGTVSSDIAQIMCVNSSGELEAVDADGGNKNYPVLGLLVESGTGSGKKLIEEGYLYFSSGGLTAGSWLYMSTDPTTTSGLTHTAPSSTGDIVKRVGVAKTTHIIKVMIDTLDVEIQ